MENKENCDDQIADIDKIKTTTTQQTKEITEAEESNGSLDYPKVLPVGDKNVSQEQDETMDDVSLLDQTDDSEAALPISLSSSISTDKVNLADSSEILNTSNESEATEPGGSKEPALSTKETREVLKEKLTKFHEWCIVNGLALSNKVS